MLGSNVDRSVRGSSAAAKRCSLAVSVAALAMLGQVARAETFVWDNTTGAWSDAARWGGVAPASNAANTIQFGSGTADYTSTFDLPTAFQLNRLDLTALAGRTNVITAPTLGNTLDFVADASVAPQINLSGGGTFRIGNSLRVAEATNLTLNVATGSNLVFSGGATPGVTGHGINPIAGTNSTLTLNGGGTVVWRSVGVQNIAVNSGLLTTDADGGFLGDANVTIGATGVIDLGGFAEGYDSLSGVAGAVLRGNASVGADSGTYRYDGIITNRPAGAVTVPGYGVTGNAAATNSVIGKSGGHTFIVSGANTHSGNTTVSAGRLVYAGDPVSATVTKGFASGAITSSPFGVGTLVVSSTGTVAIEEAVNRTIVNPMTVSATAAGGAGVTIDVPAGSELTTTGTVTFTGTLTKTGPGLWRYGGGNAAANGASVLNVNAGTVRLADVTGGDLNATAIRVNNGGTFEFGTSPALGGSENPDLPGGTYITANTGGNVIWNIGEDYGGIILDGGAFQMRANSNLTGVLSSEFRNGSITRLEGTPVIGGSQVINKTTSGTVTIAGVPLNNSGGVNIQDGVISTDAGFGGATGAITFGNPGDGVTPATTGTLRYSGAETTGIVSRPVVLTAGGGVIDVSNPAALFTFNGVASGVGTLTKTGPGTVALGTANSYTGLTTVAGGTLQVGNGGGAGSIAGDVSVAAGATLAFNRSDVAPAFAGAIGGAGGVSKLGAGTVTLTGALSYSGPTSVAAGTLRVGPATYAGGITLADGATLAVASPANAAGTLTTPSLNLGTAGSTLQLELNQSVNPTAPLVNVTGTDGLATNGGTQTIAFNNLQSPAVGTIQLIDYAGSPITTGFQLAPLPARTQGGLVYNTAATRIDLVITGSDSIKWNGNVNANWNAGTAINVGGTQNFRLVSNDASTNFVTNDAVTFDDTATGSTTVSLTTQLEPATVTVNNTDKAYVFQGAGGLAGAGSLAKQGPGNLTILTANTYTGGTTVTGGTLTIGNGGDAGDIGSGSLVNNANVVWNRDSILFSGAITNDGTLTKTGASGMRLTGPLRGTGTVNLPGGSLTLDTTGDYTYAGTISGAGSLVKNGTGLVILAGNNTHTGGTTVTSGPLQVGVGGTSGSLAGDISINGIDLANGSVSFNRSDTVTFAGNFASSGRIANTGTGNTILTGVISQDPIGPGSIVAAAGTLTLANSQTSGIFSAVTANIDGTIALDTTTGDQTYLGRFTGRGRVLKIGAGTAVLSADNTFTGTLQIDAGTLLLSDPGAGVGTAGNIDAASIVVNNGGVFQFGEGGITGENPDLPDTTYLNIKPGGVVNWRIGEQVGGTNLQGGTLNLAGGAPSNYGLTPGVWESGTLTGTANTPGNAIGLGGNTRVIKSTPGTVNVTGDATVSVALEIQDGVMSYANAINLGGNAITLGTAAGTAGTFEYLGVTPAAARGGAFAYAGAGTVRVTQATTNLTLSGVQSGAGALTKEGSGALTLTANNTLTGGVNVTGGTLLVNGQTGVNSGTGTGPVAVTNGTLGGTGSVGGSVTVSSAGRVSPGGLTADGIASIAGVLSMARTIAFEAGSVLEVQLTPSDAPVAGVDFDRLVVRGTGAAVTIADGARLNIISSGGTFIEGQSFTILDQTGGGSLTGTFQSIGGASLADNSMLSVGGQSFQISYAGGDVTLTAVPEPGSFAAALAGVGLLLARRRRHRS